MSFSNFSMISKGVGKIYRKTGDPDGGRGSNFFAGNIMGQTFFGEKCKFWIENRGTKGLEGGLDRIFQNFPLPFSSPLRYRNFSELPQLLPFFEFKFWGVKIFFQSVKKPVNRLIFP